MKEECLVLELDIKNIYVWTHDTYTKVLQWKTWNNLPPMYTSIMKLLLMWPKQIIWPLYKSYDMSTHFIKDLFIIGVYLIRNNIFLDKSYDMSTYMFKIFDQIIIYHNKRQDLMRHSP